MDCVIEGEMSCCERLMRDFRKRLFHAVSLSNAKKLRHEANGDVSLIEAHQKT